MGPRPGFDGDSRTKQVEKIGGAVTFVIKDLEFLAADGERHSAAGFRVAGAGGWPHRC